MAPTQHTPLLTLLEEAITVLFCEIDDAYYARLNPKGGRRYATLKRLSDSEVITLALFQQLRGVESERSFLREVARFFSHLFPGVLGLHPSSLHRRVRKLRRFLEPLRREIVPELVGEPETLIVDSTLLEVLHPRQVSQGSGFEGAAWVRWGTFSVYGVKLHLLCATSPTRPRLLRAGLGQRSGHPLDEGAVERGGVERGGGPQALGGSGLPRRATEGGVGRGGHLPGDREGREAQRCEAAGGDRHLDLEAGLRCGRDVGDDHHRAGDEDRGEDLRVHLRVLGQPEVGSSPREDQGVVGLNLTTHI